MLEVIEVVAELLGRAADVRCITVADLRPARNTGLDEVPASPKRNVGSQLLDEFRTFGTRADDAHVALKHVPQLRQLVQAHLAKDPADHRHSGIAGLGPNGVTLLLRIDDHRSEFPHLEY